MEGDPRVMFDRIIDEVGRWSARTHARDELKRTRASIAKLGTVCGDCENWMKSRVCPREQNVNGWNRGPSCESPVNFCKSYTKRTGVLGVEHRRTQLTIEARRLESIIEENQ